MAEQTKHTATEWNNNLNDGTVYDSGGLPVANCHSSFRSPAVIKANAQMICKAVNSHEKLVEALSDFVWLMTEDETGALYEEYSKFPIEAIRKAKTLLQSLKD